MRVTVDSHKKRIVFWGTGFVGRMVIPEILKHPLFELVGVGVSNPDQIFDFQIRDFSTYAVALHGKPTATPAQQAWALGAIRRPVSDAKRFTRIWERVRTYDGAYEMCP
jgi:hypothetical protein